MATVTIAANRLRQLRERAPEAIVRALNRAIDSAKVAAAREVAGDMGLPVSRVRDQIIVRRAARGHASASLRASAERIPLYHFKASPKEPPSRGRGRGVTARVKGTRVLYRGAFVARMRSGHVGVFRRLGAGERRSPGGWGKNLPIVQLRGPSIWKVFREHRAVALARGREQLVKNLRSELRFALRRG
jgi:hypothetical protein